MPRLGSVSVSIDRELYERLVNHLESIKHKYGRINITQSVSTIIGDYLDSVERNLKGIEIKLDGKEDELEIISID